MLEAKLEGNFEGDKFVKDLKKQLANNLEKAAIHLKSSIKKKISRKQAREKRGTRYVGLDPSNPGEAPKILSSQLVRSIDYTIDRDKLEARVGSYLKYAAALEFGAVGLQARPYFRPALLEQGKKLDELIGKN